MWLLLMEWRGGCGGLERSATGGLDDARMERVLALRRGEREREVTMWFLYVWGDDTMVWKGDGWMGRNKITADRPLSAFCVASNKIKRWDSGRGSGRARRAEVAIFRWARVGGLKEESRTKRVCSGGTAIDGDEGGMEKRTRKVCDEVAKDERADRSSVNVGDIIKD